MGSDIPGNVYRTEKIAILIINFSNLSISISCTSGPPALKIYTF